MTIKKVTVAGSGVLGSQIAFQSAFKGFDVTVYDISQTWLTRLKSGSRDCVMLIGTTLRQRTKNLMLELPA